MADEDVSSLIPIEDGSLAKAKPLRQNFTYLDNRITAQASNISNKESLSRKGAPNGYCPLDNTGKIPSTYMSVLYDEITTELQGKADVDLSNTTPTQEYKEEIMSWGMPDYSAGISISTGHTCTKVGFVNAGAYGRGYSFKINDVTLASMGDSGAPYPMTPSQWFVDVGDVITFSGISVKFYPLKGDN